MVEAPHPTISVSSKLTNLVHPYHLGLISSCMVILTHLQENLICTCEQVQNTRQMTDKVAFWSRQPARRVTGTLEVDRKESSPHQKMIVFCENDEWMVYEILPHTSSSTIYPPLWFVILNQTVERYPGQWHQKKCRLYTYPPEFKINKQNCMYNPELHEKRPIIFAC